VLDQKYRLQNSFTQKAYESGLTNVHPYSIQCIVIVGRAPTGKDERKSLELFRNSTKDVTIVTFDELLEKLKEIQRVFSASDEATPRYARRCSCWPQAPQEAVVGDQFRSAEAQHVGVDATPYQVGAQFVGAPGSIWKRLHVIGGDQLASGIDGES